MSVRAAAFIGIGSMVGAGIFALLGEAALIAGSAVWLSFLLAGLVTMVLGYNVVLIAIGLFGTTRRSEGETAIAEAAGPSLGDLGFTLIAVAAKETSR